MHVELGSEDILNMLFPNAITTRRLIRSLIAGNGNVFSQEPVNTVRINIRDISRIGVALIEILKSHLVSSRSFTKERILVAILLMESEDNKPKQLIQNPLSSSSQVRFSFELLCQTQ